MLLLGIRINKSRSVARAVSALSKGEKSSAAPINHLPCPGETGTLSCPSSSLQPAFHHTPEEGKSGSTFWIITPPRPFVPCYFCIWGTCLTCPTLVTPLDKKEGPHFTNQAWRVELLFSISVKLLQFPWVCLIVLRMRMKLHQHDCTQGDTVPESWGQRSGGIRMSIAPPSLYLMLHVKDFF